MMNYIEAIINCIHVNQRNQIFVVACWDIQVDHNTQRVPTSKNELRVRALPYSEVFEYFTTCTCEQCHNNVCKIVYSEMCGKTLTTCAQSGYEQG